MDEQQCTIPAATWIRSSILLILAVVTTVGNSIVILSILFVRILKKPKNCLLLSLAIADFLVGIFVYPYLFLRRVKCPAWIANQLGCYVWIPVSVGVSCCTASIFALTVVTLDRYVAISRPLFYKVHATTRKIAALIFITWFTSFGLLLPFGGLPEVHRSQVETNLFRKCFTKQQNWAHIIQTVLGFILPLALMLVTYAKTCRVLEIRKKRKAALLSKSKHICDIGIGKLQKKSGMGVWFHALHENKGCRMLGVMIGFFVICWLPLISLLVVVSFSEIIGRPIKFPALTYELVGLLGCINSGGNPFIYTMFNSKFREAFKKILRCKFATLNSSKS